MRTGCILRVTALRKIREDESGEMNAPRVEIGYSEKGIAGPLRVNIGSCRERRRVAQFSRLPLPLPHQPTRLPTPSNVKYRYSQYTVMNPNQHLRDNHQLSLLQLSLDSRQKYARWGRK